MLGFTSSTLQGSSTRQADAEAKGTGTEGRLRSPLAASQELDELDEDEEELARAERMVKLEKKSNKKEQAEKKKQKKQKKQKKRKKEKSTFPGLAQITAVRAVPATSFFAEATNGWEVSPMSRITLELS